MVPDLENMLGVVVHSIQVVKAFFSRVTKLVWDGGLSWWNTIPFLLNNSGFSVLVNHSICPVDGVHFRIDRGIGWQKLKKYDSLEIPPVREHHLFLMNFEFRSALSRFIFFIYFMISCVSHYCRQPIFRPHWHFSSKMSYFLDALEANLFGKNKMTFRTT